MCVCACVRVRVRVRVRVCVCVLNDSSEHLSSFIDNTVIHIIQYTHNRAEYAFIHVLHYTLCLNGTRQMISI